MAAAAAVTGMCGQTADVTYNSGSDPNTTVVLDFLTHPTCVPGTRLWAVIDGAVSGAVEAGNSPYRVGVDYPHALYTHGGSPRPGSLAGTGSQTGRWAGEMPRSGGDNPQQAGVMRRLDDDTERFRDAAGHTVDLLRRAAPQRPPCR